MDLEKLQIILKSEPRYRQQQARQAIFKLLISDWNEVTNLPKDLREKLKADLPLAVSAKVFKDQKSEKALIELADGLKIEAVLIYNADGRQTVCVSSQVGCPLGCEFCATGRMGFKRNLTAGEIIDQVLFFARPLHLVGKRVDNVVFMGMGEPFMNWPAVKEAIEILNDKDGLNISARSLSISTCGLPSGIYELIKFPLPVNLAISLHAATDNLRQQLMPIAKKYKIRKIWEALKDYLNVKNRKVMIEYLMMNEINDLPLEAKKLAELILELPLTLVVVNLIPYNETGKFKASPLVRVKRFKTELNKHGIEVTVRESAGEKVFGACGQLAGERPKFKKTNR